MALAQRHGAGRPWLWVQDERSRKRCGVPYFHGLPDALRHECHYVAAGKAEDVLFALEEGLRCSALDFVIGEIAGDPKALGFTQSRRLAVASEQHGVPLYLLRSDAARSLSAARMRWQVEAETSQAPSTNSKAPGAPAWRAELFRSRLSGIPINDNWMNKPENSLESLVSSWHPETTVAVEGRIDALNLIVREFPEVGWRLCLAQVNQHHRSATPNSRPTYRSTGQTGRRSVTYGEIWQVEAAAWELLLEPTPPTASKLVDLIEAIEGMDDSQKRKLVETLESWASTASSDGLAQVFAERIAVASQQCLVARGFECTRAFQHVGMIKF